MPDGKFNAVSQIPLPSSVNDCCFSELSENIVFLLSNIVNKLDFRRLF